MCHLRIYFQAPPGSLKVRVPATFRLHRSLLVFRTAEVSGALWGFVLRAAGRPCARAARSGQSCGALPAAAPWRPVGCLGDMGVSPQGGVPFGCLERMPPEKKGTLKKRRPQMLEEPDPSRHNGNQQEPDPCCDYNLACLWGLAYPLIPRACKPLAAKWTFCQSLGKEMQGVFELCTKSWLGPNQLNRSLMLCPRQKACTLPKRVSKIQWLAEAISLY